MSNDRTAQLRRRYHTSYFLAAVATTAWVISLRLLWLGHGSGGLLLTLLVAGLVLLSAAQRTLQYRAELKRLALIDDQKAYGGGYEFVAPDEVRAQFNNDNIWRR